MTGLSLKQIKEIFENKMRAEAQDFDSREGAEDYRGSETAVYDPGDEDRAGAIGMGEARVEEMIYDLIDAIDEMGRSNPDMTDAYIALFRALQGAGVSVKNVAMLAEGEKK
jgi:DNA-binding transcriptional MerR regulator|tara:strand:+ start:219 stop:551 length:333 start_codon:yes stop_codon:yes gene_type:complete